MALAALARTGQAEPLTPIEKASPELQKRLSFAKTYIGMDWNLTPAYGNSEYLDSAGNRTSFKRNAFLTPAINWGGVHFWGYTDFFVSVSTANIKLGQDAVDNSMYISVFTGARAYPWQLKENGNFRPFVGYKFVPIHYRQSSANGSGFGIESAVKSIGELGLGFRGKSTYSYLSCNYLFGHDDFDFPISRTQTTHAKLATSYLSFGLNYSYEQTRYAAKPEYQKLNAMVSPGISKGLFIGAGPSSAFSLQESEYNKAKHPFLKGQGSNPLFPDLAIGYHFAKPDFNIDLAYRPYYRNRLGYQFNQETFRNSIALEGYKFLFDFNGFNPYLGGGISYEDLSLKEKDAGITVRNTHASTFTPLITFGWDIRPSRKGDWLILRTNLRYAPILDMQVDGLSHDAHDMEFNFIQAVFYPQRFWALHKM